MVSRPIRPTSYVTGVPGAATWRRIMDDYQRGPPTLGIWPPVGAKP